MSKEKSAVLSVKVASEAVRAGDAESIADAQVGLVAQGLESHTVFNQLATAASLLDPKRALRDANSETAWIELVVALWKRGDFTGVAFGFALLGVKASEAELLSVEAALATVNGKRRTELISATEVVSTVIDLLHGVDVSRRPVEDRGWRRKATTRSMCLLERQPNGTFRLEVGTELSTSYAISVRSTTALSLQLAREEGTPTVHPERSRGATSDPTDILPHDLRTGLTAILRAEPTDSRFNQLLDALLAVSDSPHGEAAVALAQRVLSRWPDQARRPRWNISLTPRLVSLVRALFLDLGGLNQYAAGGQLPEVREVRVAGFSLGETRENPAVLDAFPSLHTLGVAVGYAAPGSPEFAVLSRLRLPAKLERLRLLHDHERPSAWTEDGLRALLPRIAAECLALTHLEVGNGSLAPLTELPPKIELSVLGLGRVGDAARLARTLPGRPLGLLRVTSWPGVADELIAAELPARVSRLRLEANPGELEKILKSPWPALKELSVTLPAQHARMYRRKPPDYSFTRADVEALAASRFLGQLESLELCGVIGEELAGVLVAALVRARPKLQRLTLNAGEIGNDALAALAEAGLLTSVRHLELFRCRLKGSGITALIGERGPSQLSTLVLAKNAATQGAIEAFSAWPGLTSVARLDLREVTLSPAQRECLAASPFLHPDGLDASDASFW